MTDIVVSRPRPGVAEVRLTGSERLNALSMTNISELADAFAQLGDEEELRVVTLRGDGRVFCAGADVDSLDRERHGDADLVEEGNRMAVAIRALPVPIVAAVQGAAVGVGMSVALASDLAILTSDAYLAATFTRLGLMPDAGATVLLDAAVGRARAMRTALLADRISAHDAYAWGLVSHVCEPSALDETLSAVVDRLLGSTRESLRLTKQAVNDNALHRYDEGLEFERIGQNALLRDPGFTARAETLLGRSGRA